MASLHTSAHRLPMPRNSSTKSPKCRGKSRLRPAILSALLLPAVWLAPAASAAADYFIPATGSWFTGTNWTTNTVPTAFDDAWIVGSTTVTIGAPGALAATVYAGDATAGGTIEINSGGSLTATSAIINNTGGLVLSGTGSLLTVTGDTRIGTIRNSSMTVNAGAHFTSGGVVRIGRAYHGALTISDIGTQWNAATISVGDDNSGGGTPGAGVLNILAGASVTSTISIIGSPQSGGGTVTVDGAGTTWNAGALTVGKSIASLLTISGGAHVNSSNSAVGQPGSNASNVVITGAGSQWNNTGSLSIAAYFVLNPGSSITVAEGGALNVTGNLDIQQGQSVKIGTGGAAGTVTAGTISLGGTLAVNTTNDVTLSTPMSGFGKITKAGPSTLTLTGTNTFSGGVIGTGGAIVGASPKAFGSSPINLTNTALILAGDSDTYFGDPSSTFLTVNELTDGVLTSDRLSPGAGATHHLYQLNFSGNQLAVTAGSKVTSGTAGIYFDNATFKGTGNPVFDIGTGALLRIDNYKNNSVTRVYTKTGAGMLILGNNQGPATGDSYLINQGTFLDGTDNGTGGSSSVVVNANAAGRSATYGLDSINHSIGTLTLGGAGGTSTSTNNVDTLDGLLFVNGNITFDATGNPLGSTVSGTLSFNNATRSIVVGDSSNADWDLTIAADILSGGITKTGSGTLTLGGNNYYAAAMTVSAGKLVATNQANATGSTTLTLSGGALGLAYDQNTTPAARVIVTTNTAITVDRATPGSGTITTFPGLTIGAQTLTVTAGGKITSGAGGIGFASATLNGALTLDIGANAAVTLRGAVSGSSTGSITKLGAGTLFASGTNTYTGPTTINEGKVVVTGTTTATAFTVAAGAMLASGHNTTSTVGVTTLTSNAVDGGTLAPGDTGLPGLNSIGRMNFTGALSLGTAGTLGKAHLSLEIGGFQAGTGYDQVSLSGGTINLTNVNLDVLLANSYVPSLNQRFYLVLGASNVIGAFANLQPGIPETGGLPWFVSGSQMFEVAYTANAAADTLTGGHDIAVIASVPEPSSMAFVLAAATLLPTCRLRRPKRPSEASDQ